MSELKDLQDAVLDEIRTHLDAADHGLTKEAQELVLSELEEGFDELRSQYEAAGDIVNSMAGLSKSANVGAFRGILGSAGRGKAPVNEGAFRGIMGGAGGGKPGSSRAGASAAGGAEGKMSTAKNLFLDGLKTHSGRVLLGLGIGGGMYGVAKLSRGNDMMNAYTQFNRAMNQAISSSDLLSNEDPRRVKAIGDSIFKFAPMVAGDPLVLETVLSNAVMGSGLDPNTVRSLQELEERYHKIHDVEVPSLRVL